MSNSLPAAPSLEQLRKQAKELLRACRRGDADAAARIATVADRGAPPRPAALGDRGASSGPAAPAGRGAAPKLADAQLAIAREHGFASWPRLRSYVERVGAHGPGLQHAFRDDPGYYEERASGLLASALDGTPGAVAAFARDGAPLTPAGARAVVAREHGFDGWAALRDHVTTLRDGGEPFARAYRAVEAHDPVELRAQLDRFPDLAGARGTNGNDLLGMATATGDERLVALLLARGADPAAANAHGWTVLHQAAYVGSPALAQRLLDAGAPLAVAARGTGGTPLVVALFWGHAETADLLAGHGFAPGNLRVAAGLGRLDLVDALLPADAAPLAAAGAQRGFYRPHGGFPAWRPSADPHEVVDEALAWAARSGRLDALDLLVARGARVDADVYRGSALAWAAANGHADAIERLVALGADPNARTTFGGPEHGDGATALHLAAQYGRLDAIRALLRVGADPSIRDRLHDQPAAGWAEFAEQWAAAELLRERTHDAE
ncbi:ankyrin repeat domain-containing protein [Conexibacter woesei]|uniref:Ankyrin n=1 Tax=Conexibacter woesei (strain DSM 14684 / CCUG 47730 / CIP 108061 / JCM 11494 / NBRC 100937 / ID131577) TaxID=469383 RepID=D3FBE7_CONWI|nr:ankyrin repeat domain-containing protein [Conexibacter woesei]ADB49316.1 Ankyrin [Conexibacter woesei DSM 14684]